MKVKVWGTRGSLPSPRSPEQIISKVKSFVKKSLDQNISADKVDDFLANFPLEEVGGFGGNTACVQVSHKSDSFIIDAGSGIRRLGEQLLGGPCGLGRGEAHIFFTHFHWDHLIGLPFFVPIFIPGNEIHFYAVQEDLEKCIRMLFTKPFFPVPFEVLGASIRFHKLAPRMPHKIGEMTVTPYQLDHPDPCWGYKVEADGKAFSYCIDTECTRVTPDEMAADLPLYQNVDLMLFDAQYSFLEAENRVDWGHASAPVGLDLALRERVKRIYFGHHDPAASDKKIIEIYKQTKEYFNLYIANAGNNFDFKEFKWGFIIEGDEYEV